jgi:CheY-like chemotaxis protein
MQLSNCGGSMSAPRILSVSNNFNLLTSRSLILRAAGYLVEEAHTVDKAIDLLEADSIDALLICHSIPRPAQQLLISAVREKRRLMPILCVRSYAYEEPPRTCIAVDNEPEALLNAIKLATIQ